MTSTPKRDLIKGPLRAPPLNSWNPSRTQAPASKDDIAVRRGKEKEIPGQTSIGSQEDSLLTSSIVREFSSRGVPQPFLDPSIMQRRIQIEKLWTAEQEKKLNQRDRQSSSQGK